MAVSEDEKRSAEAWLDPQDFKDEVRAWAEKLRVDPTRIQIQQMRNKWASCSQTNALTFSRDLLEQRRSFGEAVIVHEVLHLRVRNHGPLFRSLLRSLLPNHELVDTCAKYARERGSGLRGRRPGNGQNRRVTFESP